MTVMDFTFPIICMMPNHVISLERDAAALTIGWMSAIKRQAYHQMFIVDALGRGATVADVQVLRGHGRFGGYVFFDRRVDFELLFVEDAPIPVPVDALRKRILHSFRKLPTWQAFDPQLMTALRADIKAADTSEAVVRLMIDWITGL